MFYCEISFLVIHFLPQVCLHLCDNWLRISAASVCQTFTLEGRWRVATVVLWQPSAGFQFCGNFHHGGKVASWPTKVGTHSWRRRSKIIVTILEMKIVLIFCTQRRHMYYIHIHTYIYIYTYIYNTHSTNVTSHNTCPARFSKMYEQNIFDLQLTMEPGCKIERNWVWEEEKGRRLVSLRLFLLFTIDLCGSSSAKLPLPAKTTQNSRLSLYLSYFPSLFKNLSQIVKFLFADIFSIPSSTICFFWLPS